MPRKQEPALSAQAKAAANAGGTERAIEFSKDILDAIRSDVFLGGQGNRTSAGQFNKGTSGNPRGRPKRESPGAVIPLANLDPDSVSAIAMRHAARKVTAQTEDGAVEMSLKEAAIIKMVREAIKGNTGHSRTLFQLLGRAEADGIKRKRDEFRHWSEVRDHARETYAQAKQAGTKPPLSVHPDDIELRADGSVVILGPTEAGAIAVMRYLHSKVDYHIINITYYRWVEHRFIRRYRRRFGDGFLYSELDFWADQSELPPRLQLTLDDVAELFKPYAGMSGRALHALLREAAEPLELPVPPRELRAPIVVPTSDIEAGREKGIIGRPFLDAWLTAANTFWSQRAAEIKGQ